MYFLVVSNGFEAILPYESVFYLFLIRNLSTPVQEVVAGFVLLYEKVDSLPPVATHSE